jgi:HEAT repeat protein
MAQIVRMSALLALAQFDDPRVTPALRALTKDHDAAVRQQAIELLQERAENPQ